VAGEPGDADEARSGVEDHRGQGTPPAKCGARQQHPERLAGDRDRREREVDRELGERAHEGGGADHEENVSYHRTRNQVGEHGRGGPAQGR
jgi:hypothetical protein